MWFQSASANQHKFVQQWDRNINAAYDDENEPAGGDWGWSAP
jgi:hypothetical protein